MCWPDGRLQFMLNERMMPSQFVVNGEGKRFINEAAPYMDFAPRDDRRPALRRHPHPVLARHRHPLVPPLRRRRPPADPEDAVRAGAHRPEGAARRGWSPESSRRRDSFEELAGQDRRATGAATCAQTAERFNELARNGPRRRLQPRRQRLRQLLRRPDAAQPQPASAGRSRRTTRSRSSSATSARRVGCAPTSTPGCCAPTTRVVDGLYAVGNTSAAVMGRSYAGAGRDHRPGHDIRLRRGQTHRRTSADNRPAAQTDSTLNSHRR